MKFPHLAYNLNSLMPVTGSKILGERDELQFDHLVIRIEQNTRARSRVLEISEFISMLSIEILYTICCATAWQLSSKPQTYFGEHELNRHL